MKVSKLKIFSSFALFVLLMSMPTAQALADSFSVVQAYGTDTVAGYSTLLSTSQTASGQDTVISVKKPDGAVVNIPVVTDGSGIAKADLYDYHTRRAGMYEVSAYLKDSPVKGQVSYFKVYPDEISADKSLIAAQTTVMRANGSDEVYLTVNLRDKYGNPFPGHSVNVVSSRPSDEVSPTVSSSITDDNGTMTFIARSNEIGVSVFSAIDVTSGTVLSSRAQVAFLNSSSYLEDIGGPLDLFIPVAAAAGTLNKFEITDLPVSIAPNQNVNFTIISQDVDDLIVENYTGTVHFSAEGGNSANVILPEDYTFKAEDLGTHEFSLGLKFIAADTYTIVVTDTTNVLIEGTKTVTVNGEDGFGDDPVSLGGLSISTPAAGTYGQNIQTISGSAPAGTTVKIFDNDLEIGSVQVTTSATFSYQTAQLIDGDHSIYIVTVDGSNNVLDTSATVNIAIDTTPPIVDEVEINPTSGIAPGDVINIKVLSEENLSQLAIIFNQEIAELSKSLEQTGAYVASIQAPTAPGEYDVDILLVDQLGNEVTYESSATVTVSANGTAEVTQEGSTILGEDVLIEEEVVLPEGEPPSQVFGVIAYGSKERITLVWEAAIDDVDVDHYKIFYGFNPANLGDTVDTLDASTTWYVPGLENGKEYYFAIVAVDNDGLESLSPSELVNAIPFTLEVETAITERPTEALASEFDREAFLRGAAAIGGVPEMAKNGPELLWLLLGTGVLSGVSRRFMKKK